MTKNKGYKVLVVGDSHCEQGQDISRFKALGNYIKETKPSHIVSIGDFLSVDSLSAWDRNKRLAMEGRRYEKELEVGNKALDYIDSACSTSYRPTKVYIEGNHEDRLTRYVEEYPELEGKMSIQKDLSLVKRSWVWVPYKSDYNINGVSFTHVPILGNGRAISRPNICEKALRLYHNSVVFGHDHGLYHAMEHRHNAPHLNQALSVGCFFDHTADYAKGSKTDYWRGIVELDIYHPNRYNFKVVSMSSLKRQYG